MWRDRFDRYWRGLVLSGLGIAGVAWLAATGRLGWYVHPRYFWFTVTLCAVAAVALVAAVPALRTVRRAEEDHVPHDAHPRQRHSGLWIAGTVTLVLAAAAALLILPPTTLSAATAQQRQVNAGGGSTGTAGVNAEAGADAGQSAPGADADADLDVRDWAMELRQGGGATVEGRTAKFIGFVLPGDATAVGSSEDATDVFFAARFVVSCCAVDAQPLGVPVLSPGWQEAHSEGAWVEVHGVFVANPDVTSAHPVILRPYEITATAGPKDPYVY